MAIATEDTKDAITLLHIILNDHKISLAYNCLRHYIAISSYIVHW